MLPLIEGSAGERAVMSRAFAMKRKLNERLGVGAVVVVNDALVLYLHYEYHSRKHAPPHRFSDLSET
jgi:hypothetical protein